MLSFLLPPHDPDVVQLDPRRFLQVLHLPIRAMRLVTDPIVDMIAYVTFRLIVPRLLHVFKAVLRVFSLFGLDYITKKLSGNATDRLYDFSYQVVRPHILIADCAS